MPLSVTLDISDGPSAGKRLVLAPGQTALIGRASWAELAVPTDSEMSGRHFTLECDEFRCTLRDFRGSNGTHLNGGRVSEAVLRSGDRIVAGQTTFVVHIGGGEAPPPPPPPPPPKVVATLKATMKAAEPAGPMTVPALLHAAQPLFALLDAARDPKILGLLRASKEPFESLYEGDVAKAREGVAPYLVALPPESPLLPALAAAWGQSWGIYFTCDKPMADVRAHLQEFVRVQAPDGKTVYFRFYDPRVLRVFLPACDRTEIGQFFGPIRAFLLEGDDPATAQRVLPDKPRVRVETVPLAPSKPE